MKHIIAVGAVYIDTILSVPHYPSEDEKLRAQTLVRRRGGNCANTLEVLQQVADLTCYKLHLSCILPANGSEPSDFITKSLKHVALDLGSIYRKEYQEAASSYIIKSRDTDSRTIVSYNELPEMTLDEFATKADIMVAQENATSGWYHFEVGLSFHKNQELVTDYLKGRTPDVLLRWVKHLRFSPNHTGFKISIEVEKPSRDGLEEVAAEADVVFYSKSWAESKGFSSAKEFLEKQKSVTRNEYVCHFIAMLCQADKHNIALLCCTWGSAGATALQKRLNSAPVWETVQAWKPNQQQGHIVDPVGAGDTFIAGMLFGLSHHLDDWSLGHKLQFANELAGRKVMQEGFDDLGSAMQTPHLRK